MPEDIFRWVVAIAVVLSAAAFLVQAFLVLGLYRSFKDLQRRLNGLADRAEPILQATRQMVDENRPKIHQITTEATEIIKMARVEVGRISELVNETSDRARVKIASLDAALGDAAENVSQTASSVGHAVLRPLREVNGILSGVRAGLSAFLYGRQEPIDRVTQDEEMFI